MSHLRARLLAPLATVSLVLVAVAAMPLVGADPHPKEFIVGFHELPSDRASYGGDKVKEVNEELRTFSVHAGNARSFEQRAAHDPNVAYFEEDIEDFTPMWTPDDGYFDDAQYGLWGSTTNIQLAWETTKGSRAVKVCVIDTGQYRAHSDLRAVAWGEWKDFVYAKPSAYDDNGHGTHVTGILGAVLNNAKGIAGIAQVTIAGAKVINSNGYGTASTLANAITWCAAIGSHIINISLGGGWTQTLSNAVQAASDKGVLVVAAAGNRGPCDSCVLYPAAHPKAVAVACTDSLNRRCSFSSQGPQVDLAAPGLSILSTTDPDCGSTSCYERRSGTSMSTPHVAGLAALVKSAHLDYTADQIRAALIKTARDLGSSGHDESFGHGLIQGTAVR